MTDVGNIWLTHKGLSFKITAIKCRDHAKKHEISNKYMLSVLTNCLSLSCVRCQAAADFMRKLKELNLNRVCLAGGAPGLCGSGGSRCSCLKAYVF